MTVCADNPLHAAHYPDRASFCRTAIVHNERVAQDSYRLRIDHPALAAAITPGQFVMVRLADCDDPLVGRALALFDLARDERGAPCGIDLVYLVVGKLTARLAMAPVGTELNVWGPLGNGFPSVDADELVLVAGGIGHTPFLAVAKEFLGEASYNRTAKSSNQGRRVKLLYGARSVGLLSCVDDYRAAGVDVHMATEDGSAGHHGYVTDVLQSTLVSGPREVRRHVFCCGPEAMMEAVTEVSAEFDAGCHCSLESPMACGIGICFSCVTKVRMDDGSWDYKRTCVEGPIFNAADLIWDE